MAVLNRRLSATAETLHLGKARGGDDSTRSPNPDAEF
jgi:hypothetical protein